MYAHNNDVEALVKKTKKLWNTDVVKTSEKLNTEMKKLVAKVKNHGIVVTKFKKLKFVEFKGSDLDSLVNNIRMCSNPIVRCHAYTLNTVKDSVDSEVFLMLDYYGKRINLLSAILAAIESL